MTTLVRATDLPPAGRVWLSWRWLWHVANGGRIGTFCTSGRCRRCQAWRSQEKTAQRRYVVDLLYPPGTATPPWTKS